MKASFGAVVLSAFVLSAATAHAGGPVVVVDDPAPVVAEKPRSGAILPLLLVGIVLCVALCGGDDEERQVP